MSKRDEGGQARLEESDAPTRPRGRWRRGLSALVLDTRPLRIPAFRRLMIATAVTVLGSQLTAVAVPKQVYDITGSSAYVGLTGAVALVPLLVFGLWGGAVADAIDRRTLLLVTTIGSAVVSGLLWAQAAAGLDSVWLVLVLLGLQQTFFALNAPARNPSIARLVPGELLAPAIAVGSTLFQFAAVFGPLLAGGMIPLLGLPTLYLLDAVGIAAVIGVIAALPRIPPLSEDGTPATERPAAGVRSVLEGFRYMALHTVLLVSFLADIIAMVAGMPRALFPEMAERTFGGPHGGGLALGLLYAAIPLGALLCGLFSGVLGRIRRHGLVTTIAIGCWGAAVLGFGLAHALWLAVIFLALAGAADMASMIHRSAILQAAATDRMRGRMQGVFTVVVAGGPRLADLVHGTAAAKFGAPVAAATGGALVVVLMLLTVLVFPRFLSYRAENVA